MIDNTAFNPCGMGGEKSLHIISLIHPSREEIVESAVNTARNLVESLPRGQLEVLAGGLVSGILVAQAGGCSEIPLEKLVRLMEVAGCALKCEIKRRSHGTSES